MEKKSKIIIISIIILFFIASGFIYTQIHKEKIQIDEITFSLPDGYYIVNNSTKISITNSSNSFFIESFNESNTTKIIEEYKDYKINDSNETVNITTFKINDLTIYKSKLSINKKVVHYWFNYNNKTYSIYTWNANQNTDNIITELIESIN